MLATRIALLAAALAGGCTPSSPELRAAFASELADLVVSGSCSRVEDTVTLAVAVTNRGRGPAWPSATRVQFDDSAAGVVRRTRYIPAGAVSTFEVEMPAACARGACRWRITADSANEVSETDEANNTFSGRC